MYEMYLTYFKESRKRIATFSYMVLDEMIQCGRAIWVNPQVGCENVEIIDSKTGEIIWDACEDSEELEELEVDWIDDDIGYDSFMGQLTDDC